MRERGIETSTVLTSHAPRLPFTSSLFLFLHLSLSLSLSLGKEESMEVRDTAHSPPFWASASNASNPSPSTPHSSSRSSSTPSGIINGIIVLVFSIVVLLFLPSVISSPFKNARSSFSFKSGWDMLNLCLVALAILCGVLCRTGDGSGSESGSAKQPRGEWTGFTNPTGDVNRTATTIRRMRSTNSYPDLRQETDVWGQNRVPDSWRFFDDAELYRPRRPVQLYPGSGLGEEERQCKTIPVDRERLPQIEQAENEANFEERTIESDTTYEEEKKRAEAMEVRWQRRSLEALPKMEEVENEPVVVVGRRRRRSLERFAFIEEVEKERNLEEVEEEKVQKREMVVRRRRKSSETFPRMEEMEKETKVEEEIIEQPPEAVARRRTKSLDKLPEIEEVEKETNFQENVVEKPPLVEEVAPPPPPPPPPPPQLENKVSEECRKHRRSVSGGGAKDIASAISLFYPKKKKGNKSKKQEKQEASTEANPNSNSTTESNSNPSTVPPPPPPPPPASIFHQLFSNKKGGSKSRRIHSLSASTYSNAPSVNIVATPPPPPPPPPHQVPHRSRKDQIVSSGYTRIENSELFDHKRRQRSNLSPYANYPLPPRSPLPPAPPPPPPVRENVPDIREQKEQKNGSVAVFCASPDVNDKADLFIQRFRAGLKLEKINSIREKEMRKGRRGREEFGDEDDGKHV